MEQADGWIVEKVKTLALHWQNVQYHAYSKHQERVTGTATK